MKENEIMTNEGIMEVAEEATAVNSRKVLKIAGGIGLAAAVGYGVYRLAKHIREAIKAKKEEQLVYEFDCDDSECDVEDVE